MHVKKSRIWMVSQNRLNWNRPLFVLIFYYACIIVNFELLKRMNGATILVISKSKFLIINSLDGFTITYVLQISLTSRYLSNKIVLIIYIPTFWAVEHCSSFFNVCLTDCLEKRCTHIHFKDSFKASHDAKYIDTNRIWQTEWCWFTSLGR